MHIPVTQTWAQHTHKRPAGIASFSRGCVAETLGATIKKTKWELEVLEMFCVNSVTMQSQADSPPDIIKQNGTFNVRLFFGCFYQDSTCYEIWGQ